jgi:hypothetical protein
MLILIEGKTRECHILSMLLVCYERTCEEPGRTFGGSQQECLLYAKVIMTCGAAR